MSLRSQALAEFRQAFDRYIHAVPGLSVLPVEPGELETLRRANGRGIGDGAGGPGIPQSRQPARTLDIGRMSKTAARSGADAALAVGLDRFGTNEGAQRQIWVRAVAYVVRPLESSSDTPRPYYAVGIAETLRLPFLSRLQKPDSVLVRAACDQAAREVVHALATGTEPLFARNQRIMILPAAVPSSTKKSIDGSGQSEVSLPALARQSDVLFQPDLTPVVELVDSDDARRMMRSQHIAVADLWGADGRPDVEVVQRAAAAARADIVFISRVIDVDLFEQPVSVLDAGHSRTGVQRRADIVAEGAMIRASDGKVLWSDRVTGSTIARTEYARHIPRLRTDEQCVIDAAREAYAYLRFSLDDMRRQMSR